MHLSNGQSIILNWFKHNSGFEHNLSKIRVICQNISTIEDDEDDKNYLYRYFYQLVRIGLIEFLGNDNFTLSSPVLYFKDNLIIAINYDEILLDDLMLLCKSSFFNGLILYFDIDYREKIERILSTKCIKLQNEDLLKSLPNVHTFINSLETIILEPDSGFRKYNYNSWTPHFTVNEIGCYRASENIASKRYILNSSLQWKEINRNSNPDAFNLAVCYSKVESNEILGIEYHNEKMELNIFDIHFPIIIERLLWIMYIHRLDDIIIKNINYKVFKNFPLNTFKQLNRFFLNKIQIS